MVAGEVSAADVAVKTSLLSEGHIVLAPDGSQIRELVQTSRSSMVHCTLEPGAVSKAVAHRTVEEVWYFISGRGQVWRARDGSEAVVDVFSGVALSIDTGSHFQFRNTGDENLCFVIVTTPAWPGMDEAYPVHDYWPTAPSKS